jgi:hypothetical protein
VVSQWGYKYCQFHDKHTNHHSNECNFPHIMCMSGMGVCKVPKMHLYYVCVKFSSIERRIQGIAHIYRVVVQQCPLYLTTHAICPTTLSGSCISTQCSAKLSGAWRYSHMAGQRLALYRTCDWGSALQHFARGQESSLLSLVLEASRLILISSSFSMDFGLVSS